MGLFIICGHKKGERFAVRIVGGALKQAERFTQHKGTNIINGKVSAWTQAWIMASLKITSDYDWLYWHIVPSVYVREIKWRSFQIHGEFSIMKKLTGKRAWDAWQVAKKQDRCPTP